MTHRLAITLTVMILAAPLVDGQTEGPTSRPWSDRSVAELERAVARGFWPGGVIAWIDGDSERVVARGRRRTGGAKKIDAGTQFEIGSVTKAFTGLLLADAVVRQEVTLETTVADLLGKDVPCNPKLASITLRQLASHTAGVPRLPGNFIPRSNEDPYTDYGENELLAWLAADDSVRGEEKYDYSNLGMGMLGQLLARRAKTSFDELIRTRIAAPLDMKATACDFGADPAAAHTGRLPVSAWSFDALAGAGDLVSNAEDMMRLARFCLDAKRDDGLARALRLAIDPATPAGGAGMKIGLGWHVLERDGRSVVWHNGQTGGFRSFFGFERASRRAIFIAINSNGPDPTNLGFNAFFPDWPLGLDRLPEPKEIPAESLAPCVGSYRLPGGVIIEVKRHDDFLTATIPGQATFTLYPSAINEFFVTVTSARCRFLQDPEGNITTLVWAQGARETKAPRLARTGGVIAMSAAELAPYVGRYRLNDSLVFTMKVVDGTLHAGLTGQPSLPVVPRSKTEFFYRALDAKLTFEILPDGRVTAVTLHQEGREQRAPRID